MRRYFFILPLLFSTTAFALYQIAFRTGYGTYSMKELKAFQQELLLDFPAGAKITESFPGYINYELDVTTKQFDERFLLGGFVNYGSSGGRVHYEDYSGEVSSNQLVRYFSVGANLGIEMQNIGNGFSVHLDLRPQAVFSNLTVDFYSRLGTQAGEDSYTFRSFNIAIEPGVLVEKQLVKNWGVGLFAGYNVTIVGGQLFLKEDDNAYLQNSKGEDIHTNWSGLRIALGIFYSF